MKAIICPRCESPGHLDEDADAYACLLCNLWLEPRCTDQTCTYCAARREFPRDDSRSRRVSVEEAIARINASRGVSDAFGTLPCPVTEMTEREYQIFLIAASQCGAVTYWKHIAEKFQRVFPQEHVAFCNAPHESPLGGDACICPRYYVQMWKDGKTV